MLLCVLGAECKLLISVCCAEFGLFGAVVGLFVALGCELVSFLFYRYVFDMSWQPHPWLLLLLLIGALLIGLVGVFGTRCAFNASFLSVLREG